MNAMLSLYAKNGIDEDLILIVMAIVDMYHSIHKEVLSIQILSLSKDDEKGLQEKIFIYHLTAEMLYNCLRSCNELLTSDQKDYAVLSSLMTSTNLID